MNLGMFKKGYTLIEFLVVLGILVITVGALTLFLTSVFRGTNKASVSAEVKREGQSILDSLEKHIRGAVDVSVKDTNYIMLVRDFGDPLHIRCLPESVNNYKSRIGVAEDNDPSTVFAVNDPDWRSISNDDWEGGINIENCTIAVSPASVSDSGLPVPPVVAFRFTASKNSDRAEFTGIADFKTTISLRQYN